MSALSKMSDIEKAQVERERSRAIKKSLKKEAELIQQGLGTREWTPEQQQDILDGYRPKDANGVSYEGHHMANVADRPEHAGNPDNIQWLTQDEHINGAHQGNTHTPTNGYYNPETGVMTPFEGKPIAPPATELTNPIVSAQAAGQVAEQSIGIAAEQVAEVTTTVAIETTEVAIDVAVVAAAEVIAIV